MSDRCAILAESMKVPEVANAIRKLGSTLTLKMNGDNFILDVADIKFPLVERLNEAEIADRAYERCERLADTITNDDHLDPQEAEGAQHVAVTIRALRKCP